MWLFISLRMGLPAACILARPVFAGFLQQMHEEIFSGCQLGLGPLATLTQRHVRVSLDMGWPGDGSGTKRQKGKRETLHWKPCLEGLPLFQVEAIGRLYLELTLGQTALLSSTLMTHFLLFPRRHVHFHVCESLGHFIHNEPQFWRCRKFQ